MSQEIICFLKTEEKQQGVTIEENTQIFIEDFKNW